jgi:glycogen debranching enzyme
MDRAIEARLQWIKSLNLPGNLSEQTRRTLTKMLSIMKTQVYSAQGSIKHRWTTPDRWPHRSMWLWDSVFHSIGWRHVDPMLAAEAIHAVLDTQQRDGFIAHIMNPHSISEITQPPVLALGVKLVHEFLGDGEWVDSLYPKLCDYVKWDLAHRDRDGNGLVEWAIEGDPHCRSGESGMDNSPRFDSATLLDAVDFNSFLALECEVLAGFANRLGKPEEAKEWNSMHQRLCQLIREKLWSEEHRFFVDYDIEKQAYSPVLASSGFLPLICGAADPGQAAALAQHLEDPRMFGTAFPVPSIAAKDMEHYSKDMWRGPTWINMNWLIAYGLDRYGMEEAAHRLRQQTIHHIEASCEEFGVAFEYFDDRDEVPPPQLKRKGKCAPQESAGHQAFHDYGWTATLYTDLIYSA